MLKVFYFYLIVYPLKLADKYSRFMRAIFSKEIPFGHSTSQAPVFVQLPNLHHPSVAPCLIHGL